MDELIRDLFKSPRGSRALDDRVERAVYGEPTPSGNAGEQKILHVNHGGGVSYSVSPHYTTSVDAALELVPKGASASATKQGNGRGAAEIWTYVSQIFSLHAIKMAVGGEIKLRGGLPIKWRKGQFLVFKDRRPIGTMTNDELSRARSAACNLPKNIVHHQNLGAATPALALCIAALKARNQATSRAAAS